jgi:serine/threonine-protein kinase
MTQTAQVIGTAQYLSPEQARGERVDARSDLYSAGCLLYELLTGRPPFTGDSPVAIAYQHVREAPVPPSRIDPELPAWCDAIVLKAMEKDPADRYQSAGEMRNDIQRALSGAPVAASMHHTEMYNTGTRRLNTQATQVAGATSAIPPYAYGPDTAAGRGGDYGEPPRRRAWPWILVGAIILLLIGGGIFAYKFVSGSGGSISVPAVDGLSLAQARAKIVQSNLVVGTVTDRASSTVASGDVISTDPSNGTNVKAHSAVDLFVSAGAAKKTVPDLTGKQEAAAVSALASAGLSSNVKEVQSTAPAGQVVSQSPPGGTQVAPGTQVTLSVSEGGSSVPNVIGKPVGEATQILQGKGFQVNQVTGTAPTGTTPGTVYAMSPSAGSTAQPGATITIDVAAAATTSPPVTTSPPDTTSPPTGFTSSPPVIG